MTLDLRAAADFVRAAAADRAELIYGVPIGTRCACPIHGGDNTSSFEVHADGRWSCWTRGAHGDAIDFVAQREHDVAHGSQVRGEVFRLVVPELLARLGANECDFERENAAPKTRGKPYPPFDEVAALLMEARLPLWSVAPGESPPTSFVLGGRERPGIGSYAHLQGLDAPGQVGLVRLLPRWPGRGEPSHRPEWARSRWWCAHLALVPTYDASGELVSVRGRHVGGDSTKSKARAPKGFGMGALMLNRPARELLRGEASGKQAARDHGVVVAEGEPGFLAWSSWHPGPVFGLPGAAPPARALGAIPLDAPVYVDTDPDAAGYGYATKALGALTKHTNVSWSARLASFAASKRKPTDADRAADPRLRDPDERDGRAGVMDGAGWTPIPADVREGVQRDAGPTRPEIVVRVREDEVAAEAVAALAADPEVYQRARQLVRVLPASELSESALESEHPVISALPLPILRERLAAAAAWMQPTDEGARAVHPPKWAVEAVHARGEWAGIRRLTGVVEQPTLRPDGSVLTEPGYDSATGLLFIPPPGEPWPEVPEHPTRANAVDALAELADIVCDVRFGAEHHRSAWLALVLTLTARHAIAGPVPMWLIEAPVAGAGKGLFGDVACRIGTGRAMPLDGYPRTDAEMDKRLLAWALAGRSVVGLDNVAGRLGGESLCRALTATVIGGRVLGKTEEKTTSLRATFVATGNNVDLGQDMHRRVCHVRLAPPEEDPSLRTGFRYPDLVRHVMAERPRLVIAVLTVLRAYLLSDANERPKLTAWGSYEEWSALVRGALVWAGYEDPAECRAELRASGDDLGALHRALVVGWRELALFDRGPVTTKRALEIIQGDANPLPELRAVVEELATDRRGNVSAGALGRALRGLRQRVFVTDSGPVMLDAVPARAGVKAWTVVAADDGGDGGDGGDDLTTPHARARAHAPAHTRAQVGRDENIPTIPTIPTIGDSDPSEFMDPGSVYEVEGARRW